MTKEIINLFDITIKPLPFSDYTISKRMPVGTKLEDILLENNIPSYADVNVFINQTKIDPDLFNKITIEKPCELIIKTLPKGGGGKKNKLRTIAQIALMTITPLGAGGKFLGLVGKTAKIVGSLVTYGLGNALINSVLPPQQASLPNSPNTTVDKAFQSITGIRNNLNPDGPIPITFGTDLVYPVFGAQPNTYVKDNKQFLRAIFVLGLEDFNGQITMTDMKIGNTPISSYDGVEVESDINYGKMTAQEKAKWFPNIVTDEYNILVNKADTIIRTTQSGITGLEVELTFSSGLVYFDGNGSRSRVQVSINVEYRKVGDTEWIPVADTGYIFTNAVFGYNIANSAIYDDTPNQTLYAFGGGLGAQMLTYNYATGSISINNLVGLNFDNMSVSYDGTFFYLTGGIGSNKSFKVTNVGTVTTLPNMNRTRSFHSSVLMMNEDGTNKRLVIIGGEALGGNGTIEYLSIDTPTSWGIIDETAKYILDVDTGIYNPLPYFSGAHVDPFAGKSLINSYYHTSAKLKGGNGVNSTSVTFYNGANNFFNNGISYNGYTNSLSFDASFSLIGAVPFLFGSSTDYKLVGGISDGNIYTISGEQISDVKNTTYNSIYRGGYVYNKGNIELISGFVDNVSISGNKRVTSIESTIITGNSTATVIRTFRKDGLESGQYEIKVLRNSDDDTSANISSKFYLTAVRNFLPSDVIVGPLAPKIKTVCLAIQASEKLTGVVDTFNGVVTRLMPVPNANFDGGFAWSNTQNPASCALQVLLGNQAKRNLKSTQIDWVNVREWYDFCETNSITFNHTQTAKTKLGQLVETIARAGMATQTELDGKRKFLFDAPKTNPSQLFTQRNIIADSYEIQKRFIKVPDSLIVRYRDKSVVGWPMTTVEIFNDGFDSSSAVDKEKIDFIGATDYDYVYKMARRYLADLMLRQEVHTFSVSIDGLVSTRGDMIVVSQTNLLIGNGTGRIKTIEDNGSEITGIILDYDQMLALATVYEVSIRTVDTVGNEIDVIKFNGQWDATDKKKINFDAPLPTIGEFTLDDLISIGTNQELLIKEVKNKKKERADLICVPYAEGVYTSDTSPIPPFTPVISFTPEILRGEPEPPIIDNIRTDLSVMYRDSDGSLKATVLISLKSFSSNTIKPDAIQARYKRSDDETDAWLYAPQKNADTLQINLMEQIEEKVDFDISVRYLRNGVSSEWVTTEDVYVVGKTLEPSDVQNLVINTNGFNLELAWDNISDIDLLKYVVKVGSYFDDFDSAALIDEVDDNRKVLTPVLSGEYQYFVKAKDTSKNLSINSAIVALPVLDPQPPLEFTGVGIINQIQFGWTSSRTTWRIANYRIYKGEVFATSSLIKDNSSALGYLHTEVNAGTFKYWIQATDIAGNISTPVSVVVAVDEPTDFNFFGQYSGDFSLAEATSESNILRFVEDGRDFVIPCLDDSKTWSEHFTDNAVASMQDFINLGFIYYLEPVIFDASGNVVNASYTKDFDVGAVVDSSKIILALNRTVMDFDVFLIRPTVRFRELLTDPWSVVTGEMIVFANNYRYLQIQWDFLADSGRQLIDLNAFTVDLSIQKKEEFGQVEADSVATVLITPNTTFLDFKNITVTQLFKSGYTTNLMVLVADITNEPASFDIEVFNANGTPNTTEKVLISYSITGV